MENNVKETPQFVSRRLCSTDIDVGNETLLSQGFSQCHSSGWRSVHRKWERSKKSLKHLELQWYRVVRTFRITTLNFCFHCWLYISFYAFEFNNISEYFASFFFFFPSRFLSYSKNELKFYGNNQKKYLCRNIPHPCICI